MKCFNSDTFRISAPLRFIFTVVIISATLFALFYIGMLLIALVPFDWYTYETTEPADYGTYIGNNDNDTPRGFICSFFPETIEEDFSCITYSYRAESFDTFGYEAYLEFTIEDSDTYHKYISQIGDAQVWQLFKWDDHYRECTISHEMSLHPRREDGSYPIENARIGKILRCDETQTLIFVAIGVYDGGGVGTDFLCVFFERFNINPMDFAYGAGITMRGDKQAINDAHQTNSIPVPVTSPCTRRGDHC